MTIFLGFHWSIVDIETHHINSTRDHPYEGYILGPDDLSIPDTPLPFSIYERFRGLGSM